jgi:hypothetical protein
MIRIDRVLRWKPNMLRAWGLGLAAGCFACTQALACMPSSERSIIFERVPADLYASVIVEVTIDDREPDVIDPSNGGQMAVMNARIDRVIKGSIDSGVLKIVTYLSECSRIGVGRGIVAGTLRHDAQRGLELVAIQESNMRAWSEDFLQRQMNMGSGRGGK